MTSDREPAPDGSWLATGGYDRAVRLWDMATGKQRAVFGGYRSGGRPVEFEPDGVSQLVSTFYDRLMQALEDVARPKERALLARHWKAAYAIAVAPDGSWLAVTGLDPKVRVWDVATGNQRFVLDGHRGEVYAAAVAPDGSWMATGGGDGTVRIWDGACQTEWDIRLLVLSVYPPGSRWSAGAC
jgi:WD40 repeat protein